MAKGIVWRCEVPPWLLQILRHARGFTHCTSLCPISFLNDNITLNCLETELTQKVNQELQNYLEFSSLSLQKKSSIHLKAHPLLAPFP